MSVVGRPGAWAATAMAAALGACALPATDEPAAVVETVTVTGARVVRAEDGALTPPSSRSAAEVALDVVAARAELAPALDVGRIMDDDDGTRHVDLGQRIAGLRVDGAYARVAVAGDGAVLQVIDALAPDGPLAPTAVTAEQALATALVARGIAAAVPPVETRQDELTTFATAPGFAAAPTVERVAYPTDLGFATGYVVATWVDDAEGLLLTRIAADGAVRGVEHRTAYDRYRVFSKDPDATPQRVRSGPGAGNSVSRQGWLSSAVVQFATDITGPNAHAAVARTTAAEPVADGEFLATAALDQPNTTAANRATSAQNLFYLINIAHDVLAGTGFDDAAGNFQLINRTGRGVGRDPVDAVGLLAGFENGSMTTPGDGASPSMRIGTFRPHVHDGELVMGTQAFEVMLSELQPAVTGAGVRGKLARFDDGTGATGDACQAARRRLDGMIAIIDRGRCDFTAKIRRAQAAGAIAVLFINNIDGERLAPGGEATDLTIPAAMLDRGDGPTVLGQLGRTARLMPRRTPKPPNRDGALDADIVFHEYAHGLTARVIGNMSGSIAGATGEGASDTFAFIMNGDDRFAEWAVNDPRGGRGFPYQDYPLTYADLTGAEVHDDGEIYAAAMWRVRAAYVAAGLSRNTLLRDWIAGMKRTPAAPSFEDMRDGMIAAVPAERRCFIWRGFAALGIGEGAAVHRTQPPTVTESFTVPVSCR